MTTTEKNETDAGKVYEYCGWCETAIYEDEVFYLIAGVPMCRRCLRMRERKCEHDAYTLEKA